MKCLKTDDFEKEMKIGLLTIVFGFSEATETRDLAYRRPRWKELLQIMKNDPSNDHENEGIDARGKKGKERVYITGLILLYSYHKILRS